MPVSAALLSALDTAVVRPTATPTEPPTLTEAIARLAKEADHLLLTTRYTEAPSKPGEPYPSGVTPAVPRRSDGGRREPEPEDAASPPA